MTARLLDGKETSARLRDETRGQVEEFTRRFGRAPSLAVVRVGEDAASVSYARMIERSCGQVGVSFALHRMASPGEDEVVELVRRLSEAADVDGIMVQEPLPSGVSRERVISALAPHKDVDGVHPLNAGRLMQDAGDYFVPATPAGGVELLERYEVPIRGKRAVVVGRSNVVGRPMALLLLHRHATVTICHSRTANLAEECRRADILVAATGRAGLITGDMVGEGAVVVDFGVNFVDGKMVGDVDFEAASQKASLITPVPGGTGPMTNQMLMRNVLKAAQLQRG
ncbi:MAG: bifunctional 5,10-methylenetetrahydrofolate dehydrogenase/5,10-methenyltetrahydrofolate cyclohydrolase [Anaerolineae bacterium]|nr:bifunctional 5,10-methylenetetrahydrofolate dehydrogenase/5,10-methenyltetrahydrofolate cyclohydrolase [Anaerolineae bacterium]